MQIYIEKGYKHTKHKMLCIRCTKLVNKEDIFTINTSFIIIIII